MSHTLVGHDAIFDRFRRALRMGRLASTFLFVGPAGVGKRLVANRIAQCLLCERTRDEDLDACGECHSCLMFAAGTHPDFIVVSKPDDRATIPVELFLGDREHRMQEGLCHDISLKPFYGGRKIAIIDDADYLNAEGANCLLKTLEEPPPRSLLILIGASEQKQLPTIRSRCQTVRFRPLPDDVLQRLLLEQKIAETPAEAASLAALAGGSLQRAAELADSELREFRRKLLAELPPQAISSVALAREVAKFVDQAGKEAPPRRVRLRLLLGFAADYYRQIMTCLAGGPLVGDDLLRKAVQSILPRWGGTDETAADCVETCLTYEGHVDANANLTTLVECWIDELADKTRLVRAG